MSNLKFYRCNHCGKVIVQVVSKDVPTICCGEAMEELTVNTVEGAGEKHKPVITRDNNKITVTVGSVLHPMMEKHYIEFVVLETEKGFRVAYLQPGDEPKVDFLEDEKVIAVYDYCNLHGLWKTEA